MKQSKLNAKECNRSKNTNLTIGKTQKKSSRKNTKKVYEKTQFMYEYKLHQKHENAVHAIFASMIF